jgi:hypothetical protein
MRRQMQAVDRDLAEHGVSHFMADAGDGWTIDMGDEPELRELASSEDLNDIATIDITTTRVPGHRQLFAMCVMLARGILRGHRKLARVERDLEAVKNSLDSWR